MALGPRAFLKQNGFILGTKPASIDKAFLKSFPADQGDTIKKVWDGIHFYGNSINTLYALPSSQKQAAILFSQDSNRSEASLKWLREVVLALEPTDIIEFGCGAGFLLQYLRHLHPNIKLTGIDLAKNLLDTIPKNAKINIVNTSYHRLKRNSISDLAICDFGWDNSDVPHSTTRHSTAYTGKYAYCPGCSDDTVPFFHDLLESMKHSVSDKGAIAICGRLPGTAEIRALYEASKSLELSVCGELTKSLRISNIVGQKESFPAFVFKPLKTSKSELTLLDCLDILKPTTTPQ